jgi:hypothetical protein
MRKTVLLVVVAVALALSGLALTAFADDGSGSAAPDSGSAAPNVSTPVDALGDPLSAPAEAWSDLQAAQKVGWPLAILAGVVMLARLLGRLGGVWSRLREGKVALAIGALSATSCAAYNALALGGSWLAVAAGAIVAGAAAWDAAAKKPDAGGN